MLELSFRPFPVLNTEHLTLRRMAASDVQEVFDIRSHSEAMKYSARPLAQNEQYAADHIRQVNEAIDQSKAIHWAITLKGQQALIGMLGLVRIQPRNFRAEVGYILHPRFQQKGIMQEALAAVLDYGFLRVGLNSVIAVVDPANSRSIHLLKKFDFTQEAHLKENIFVEGKFRDTLIYSLLQRHYLAQQ